MARRRLTEEIPEATEDELRETLGHIQFLDYYIRFTLRGNVVAALADAGLKVHIIGAGWENLPCSHPENLILSPYASSEECLLALADAKLALNVLPCFHAGAHDRIFNTMLAGAVCVTDSNPYLDQILIDEENVILYDRERPGELADRLTVLCSRRWMKSCRRSQKLEENWQWQVIPGSQDKNTGGNLVKYDYLIVGAGLFGCVFAHEMKKAGKSCLVIEKKRPYCGQYLYERAAWNPGASVWRPYFPYI